MNIPDPLTSIPHFSLMHSKTTCQMYALGFLCYINSSMTCKQVQHRYHALIDLLENFQLFPLNIV